MSAVSPSSLWFQTNHSSPEAIARMPVSRLRALHRDFTELIGQQMYFWGRDVIHPCGNLLCEYGFERRKSEGLEGTSCYRKKLDESRFIELHGACAGCYDRDGRSQANFLYIRTKKRCFLYAEEEPPAPGFYATGSLDTGPAFELYFASLRFLDWWLDYEKWIEEETSPNWRVKNYAAFASLPASRPSLPPSEAVRWLRQYRNNPVHIARVSEWMRSRKRR